ncbi:hypothetical protein T440DRAFT_295321 [Plenodomus tracheiphilus IPT5]|uniref:Uncharacterized protein n=1 Tax=Plenodomus tracheiphilus IPT5 TaxID=1408161 RepID=A0A6A7BIN2_9PLEO|nr:hypothetical protein T440DRAFT_295321 [Plenodomus tracheiphilus IPT5]
MFNSVHSSHVDIHNMYTEEEGALRRSIAWKQSFSLSLSLWITFSSTTMCMLALGLGEV